MLPEINDWTEVKKQWQLALKDGYNGLYYIKGRLKNYYSLVDSIDGFATRSNVYNMQKKALDSDSHEFCRDEMVQFCDNQINLLEGKLVGCNSKIVIDIPVSYNNSKDAVSLEQWSNNNDWWCLISKISLEKAKQRAAELFAKDPDIKLRIVRVEKTVLWSLGNT